MWRLKVILVLVLIVHALQAWPFQSRDSLVTTPQSLRTTNGGSTTTLSASKPQVYALNVRTDIRSRYARTLVTSRIANPADRAQEVTFQVTIPESAFVSKFVMEVDGEMMEGIVRERMQAKQDYQHAVQSGQTAGHVATASVRDSSHVRISVNVAAHSKASFNLTYEELLVRRKGRYELAINLNPGQLVREMAVDVYIQETTNITKLTVPAFRSSNEIDFNESDTVSDEAVVEWVSGHQAHVHFAPTLEAQRRLGAAAGSEEKGLGGQFIVRYDVAREHGAGEVLALDGYFVHFFAPPELSPLPKHVVFVLDVSGSMYGRKIEQLREAMDAILRELQPGDYFNLIEFSSSVTIMDLEEPSNSTVLLPELQPYFFSNSETTEEPKAVTELPLQFKSFPANDEFITKAREAVKKMSAGGGTNIYDAVRAALGVASKGVSFDGADVKLPDPIIIFLTDGEATVGETRHDRILTLIAELSSVPVFSLSFGQDADLSFLKRLSLRSGAFARKIYEAADAALQLQDFYRQIASPLLSNVSFSYLDSQVDGSSVTKQKFSLLFSGSELIVAGKLRDVNAQTLDLQLGGEVRGVSTAGASTFSLIPPRDGSEFLPPPGRPHMPATPSPQPGDRFLERLWAFLSIRQLLEQYDAERADDKPTGGQEEGVTPSPAQIAKSKALELALKFSFVTPVTSLVVVKTVNTSQTSPTVATGDSTTAATPLNLNFGGIQPVFEEKQDSLLLSARPAAFSGQYSSGYHGQAGASGVPIRLPSMPNRATTVALHPPPQQPITVAEENSDVSFSSELEDQQMDFNTTTPTMSTPVLSTNIPQQMPILNLTLMNIESIKWLQSVENETTTDKWRTVSIANHTDIYKLLYANQSSLPGDFEHCIPPISNLSEWKCRPLADCVLAEFVENADQYLTNFKCLTRTEGYLGACCPEQQENNTSTLETQPVVNIVSETTTLTSVTNVSKSAESTVTTTDQAA